MVALATNRGARRELDPDVCFIRASGESRLSVVDQFPISVYQAQDMSQVLCNNLTRCEPTLWIFRRVKSLIVDPVEESMLLIKRMQLLTFLSLFV